MNSWHYPHPVLPAIVNRRVLPSCQSQSARAVTSRGMISDQDEFRSSSRYPEPGTMESGMGCTLAPAAYQSSSSSSSCLWHAEKVAKNSDHCDHPQNLREAVGEQLDTHALKTPYSLVPAQHGTAFSTMAPRPGAPR